MNKKPFFIVIFLISLVNFSYSGEVISSNSLNSAADDIVPLKTAWKFNFGKENKIPDLVYSEGMFFWGNEEGILFALDTKTGKIKWQFKADGAIYEKPTVKNGIIYFCAYNGYLYAVNILTGQEKWKYFAGQDLRFKPVVFQNKVIIGYKKNLICLDMETGLDLWKKNCISMNYLDYQFSDSVIFMTDNLEINALDAANCNNLWTYSQKVFGMSRIESAFDFIYYCNLEGIFAINSNLGKLKWKFQFDQKNPPKAYQNMLVNDSSLYVHIDNILYVFNAITGKIQWGYKLKKDITNVAVFNSKTYFTESSNIIYCMNNKNTKKIEKLYSVEGNPVLNLQIYNGMGFYLTADGFIYAVKIP